MNHFLLDWGGGRPSEVQVELEPEPSPTATLFVQDLPAEATDDLVAKLFGAYAGFRAVRGYVPGGNSNCAKTNKKLVDYDSTHSATAALQSLASAEIRPGVRLNLTYANANQKIAMS